MPRHGWLVILAFVGLVGCFDQKAVIAKLMPEAEDRQARQFLELVRDGKTQLAREMLGGSMNEPQTTGGLEDLRQVFTQSKWLKVEPVGITKFHSTNSGTNLQLQYQIQLERHWVAGSVVLSDQSGGWKIISARFNTIPDSLDVIYGFTFSGKGFSHYAIFLAGCLVPLFCVFTLVVCLRSKIKRKWLWVLFILLPIGKVSLNWTSGDLQGNLLAFQLLGVSAFRMGLAVPWIVGVSFPLGAILFLLSRKGLLAAGALPPPPTPAQ